MLNICPNYLYRCQWALACPWLGGLLLDDAQYLLLDRGCA